MPYDIKVHRGDTTLSFVRTQDAMDDLDARIVDGGVYIQSTAPTVQSGLKYLWIDTSGSEPIFNIHNGSTTFRGKLVPV